MIAVCGNRVGNVGVESVFDPEILIPRHAMARLIRPVICGSGLHLYGGRIPSTGEIRGEIDHSFVLTQRLTLEDAPQAYEAFRKREDECVEAVLTP
jgi:threonine dehydrogenase-like Zn-dependent dehydrogenase